MIRFSLSHLARWAFEHLALTRIAAATLMLMMAAGPAAALHSAWTETEGARMRLVVDPEPRVDGLLMGFLEIDLTPGWKTYWRDPGSAGIPPMLDLSQSNGIVLEAFDYPPPVRVDDGYAVWAGYTSSVRFPLSLRRTSSGAADIRALAFVGVCDKICVPFQAELALQLPASSNGSDADRQQVDDALSMLPEAAGPDFAIASAQIDVNKHMLDLTARLPAFRPKQAKPELFVAADVGFAFAQPELLADENGMARWQVRIEAIPDGVEQDILSRIDVVITLGQRAMAASLGHAKANSN